MTENELSKIVFDLGLKIHKKLGPGLFENVYEECLFYELQKQGLKVEKQIIYPSHKAQLLTYLKMTDCKLGLLINFNEETFKAGVSRVINGYL